MIIELRSVSFSYRTPQEIPVFSGISCSIGSGEIIGVVGRTGSGKSTFLQLCAGLLEPDTGDVFVNGIPIKKPSDWTQFRKTIGIAFQFPEKQLFEETVFDDIAFGLTQNGFAKEEIAHKVHNAMELVGLHPEQYAARSPYQLSSGEKRRAAIAGILAPEPEIVFLDEPTIGLDYNGIRFIESFISQFHSSRNTVCLASHNFDFLYRTAQRIIVINSGIITADAPKEDLFRNPDMRESLQLEIPAAAAIKRQLKQKYGIEIPEQCTIEEVIEAYRRIFTNK